ncbi:hypothetical protein G6011_03819 [Alternaria panax]|uniref:MFS general substrate transporter n=1 Tax=Alternaria panax TaxID=48097 RepID=A0AAD4IFZ7_9PLEO|nr:hypothetical protein G6011_03819 [Alternaria panax]
MYAQALVLFNVFGIPLSSATRLEHDFTSVFPTKSLVSLAAILGLQILVLFASPLPIGYLYNMLLNWKHQYWWTNSVWKLLFGVAVIVATTSELLSYKVQKDYIAILLLRGLALGGALGTCFTTSTLVLASHYRNDVPLVSVQPGFAGFAGAVVYTIIAHFAFQSATGGEMAYLYSGGGGIMGATLLAAFFLLVGLNPHEETFWTQKYKLHLCVSKGFFRHVRGGGMWFILGYMLVFMGVLVYPIYCVVLLTQVPGLFLPDAATYGVFGMLSVAAISGSFVANMRSLKKVGAVNIFVAASVLAGAVCLAPVVYSRLYVVVPLALVYGVALGAILSLHMIVAASFLSKKVEGRWEDDMPARVAIVMALAGFGAFGVIVGAAALIEGSEKGEQIVMKAAGVCMIGGGVLVACARMWRWREKQVSYAV